MLEWSAGTYQVCAEPPSTYAPGCSLSGYTKLFPQTMKDPSAKPTPPTQPTSAIRRLFKRERPATHGAQGARGQQLRLCSNGGGTGRTRRTKTNTDHIEYVCAYVWIYTARTTFLKCGLCEGLRVHPKQAGQRLARCMREALHLGMGPNRMGTRMDRAIEYYDWGDHRVICSVSPSCHGMAGGDHYTHLTFNRLLVPLGRQTRVCWPRLEGAHGLP
jgi:hypothetical protein